MSGRLTSGVDGGDGGCDKPGALSIERSAPGAGAQELILDLDEGRDNLLCSFADTGSTTPEAASPNRLNLGVTS